MKSRPRAKSKKQQKRELYIAFGVLVLLFTLISSCVSAVFGDDEEEEWQRPATTTAAPSATSSLTVSTWTVPPQPTRTRTAKPKPRSTPTKTRTRTIRPRPKPSTPSLPSVRPGAFCSPTGAQGVYNGRIYTCKGPGQPRWRR